MFLDHITLIRYAAKEQVRYFVVDFRPNFDRISTAEVRLLDFDCVSTVFRLILHWFSSVFSTDFDIIFGAGIGILDCI